MLLNAIGDNGEDKLPAVSKVNSPLSKKIGENKSLVSSSEKSPGLEVSKPSRSTYSGNPSSSVACGGSIHSVVEPLALSTSDRPQIPGPLTLRKDASPVVPVVNSKKRVPFTGFVFTSSFTPLTVLPKLSAKRIYSLFK